MTAPIFCQAARQTDAFETEILSAATGRCYRIQTATVGEMPSEGYPVLFVLDGEAFFPALLNIMQSLMDNPITQSRASCLIVGIGYPGGKIRDLAQRAADYTPPLPDGASESDRQQFGGAERFARFIDQELFPLLETAYSTDRRETAVFGHSFGALFGLYSLLTAPRFRRHLLVSPSIWWQNKHICTLLGRRLDGTSVRIAVGEHENGSGCGRRERRGMNESAQEIIRQLQALGADTGFCTYPGANHGNTPFYALTDCVEYLRQVWQRKTDGNPNT